MVYDQWWHPQGKGVLVVPQNPAITVALPQRTCTLAHDLNNKIAVIITHCELLGVHVHLDDRNANRLRVIMQMAEEMAEAIKCQREKEGECRATCAAGL